MTPEQPRIIPPAHRASTTGQTVKTTITVVITLIALAIGAIFLYQAATYKTPEQRYADCLQQAADQGVSPVLACPQP